MAEMDNTVAMPVDTGMEQSADDAQAAEISVEELAAQLMDTQSADEQVENEGDDSQSEQTEPETKQQEQETSDKVGRIKRSRWPRKTRISAPRRRGRSSKRRNRRPSLL